MMAQDLPQLFGVVPTGLPPIIAPTSAPSQTSFIYTLSPITFSHIVVFLLPGITLPPNTAAAVYISLSSTSSNSNPNFKFLGGIGPGKESALFKISGLGRTKGTGGDGEVDMDAPDERTLPDIGEVHLGISIESAESVSARMASLSSPPAIPANTGSQALVPVSRGSSTAPNTLVLAQRIIKNAFNFLASFSGNINGGVEVVPLKAFEEWWRKFEGRVRSDSTFLERDSD